MPGNIKSIYKIGHVLGEGSFGSVRVGLHRKANVKCAIKIINKDKINSHPVYKKLMMDELEALEKVNHPNILRIYELLEDQKHYFIVSEYMKHGELYDFIVEGHHSLLDGTLTEQQIMEIIK